MVPVSLHWLTAYSFRRGCLLFAEFCAIPAKKMSAREHTWRSRFVTERGQPIGLVFVDQRLNDLVEISSENLVEFV